LLKKRNPQDRPDWTPGVVVVRQFVPMYGARDWWAEKAKDKDWVILAWYLAGKTYTDLYTVPTGKLLLIAELHVSSEVDGGIYLRAVTAVYERDIVAILSKPGTRPTMVFSKPKRVQEGETLQLLVEAGVGAAASTNIGGWEIELE